MCAQLGDNKFESFGIPWIGFIFYFFLSTKRNGKYDSIEPKEFKYRIKIILSTLFLSISSFHMSAYKFRLFHFRMCFLGTWCVLYALLLVRWMIFCFVLVFISNEKWHHLNGLIHGFGVLFLFDQSNNNRSDLIVNIAHTSQGEKKTTTTTAINYQMVSREALNEESWITTQILKVLHRRSFDVNELNWLTTRTTTKNLRWISDEFHW